MEQNKEYYNNFFRKNPVHIHDNAERFFAVAKLLKGKCLDVACGTGTLSDYFTGDYVGVDFSDVAIKKAKSCRRKNAKYVVGDFTKSNFESEQKFDSVYLGEFLEHIENDEVVFKNVLKFLKKDGVIIVTVPNYDMVPDQSHCRTFTVPQIRKKYSKYGKITFHNWVGFSKRILFTIEPQKKNENKISLVMIVKNEEKGIEKAIISALPLVDNVVVSVDSLNTDKTREIAELYADDLRSHVWDDNFSKARNEASEFVNSKWILVLDGHEYIESTGKIDEYIDLDVDGIFVSIRMETGLIFKYPRIYRNNLKFENAVHNIVKTPKKRLCSDFIIVHDRKNLQTEESTAERNKQRDEMMPNALREQIKKNKKDVRAHFHLANYLVMKNNNLLALKHYNKVIKYCYNHDMVYMSLITKGRIHLALGNNHRALWAFNKADSILPNRFETARILGGFYMVQGNFKKAIDYFFKALKPNKRHYSYEPLKYDICEFYDRIGHCYSKLDAFSESLDSFKLAKKHCKDVTYSKLLSQKILIVQNILNE